MTHSRRTRLPVEPPSIAAPAPFVERRVEFRRASDRLANEETLLLARALDVLASGSSAEERLAAMLDLLARMTGARRVAVLANGQERRVAVSVGAAEDSAAAQALAAWLDAEAPRSRADRAATPAAAVSLAASRQLPRPGATAIVPGIGGPSGEGGHGPHYACLAVPGVDHVLLGFDFADPIAAGELGERLTPNLARHAALALALVTDQLATERELAELRARDAERAQFVPNVAHELRTPLTGLNGYLELILSGGVDDPAVTQEFLERSREIVTSMSDLVGDLLEFARLESGSVQLDLRPFSVAEVAQRALAHIAPIALARDISVRSELPPRLRTGTGDRRRVEQILVNLVGNALKFTPPGGSLELAAWFDGPVALAAVRDDGPGIDMSDRARIFERFYRINGHERINGTGLGLPIARELARAMGGDLVVASVLGSGSSFVLCLPGPTAVDRDVIGSTLTRAMAAEEIRIGERALLRRAQNGAMGDPLVSMTPDDLAPVGIPAVRPRRGAPDHDPALVRPRAGRGHSPSGTRSAKLRLLGGRDVPSMPVHLRAIDGIDLRGGLRPDDPTTA